MVYSLKTRKVLKTFLYLWKVEDDDWLSERKEIWRELQTTVFEDVDAQELKEYRDYFINGTLNDYISPSTLYFLTPLPDKDTANNFFESDFFTDRDRESVYLLSDAICKAEFDNKFVRNYVALFTEIRLGGGVTDVKVNGKIKYQAGDFVNQYLIQTRGLFRWRNSFSPALVTMQMFLDSLPLLKNEKIIDRIKSKDMFSELFTCCLNVVENNNFNEAERFHANQLLKHKDEILAIWEQVSKRAEA